MTIQNFINSRISWFILSFSSASFLGAGFYFQYIIGLQPCHMCILQRIAFLCIFIFSLISLLNPKNKFLQNIGFVGWLIGSAFGTYIGSKLVYTQMFPKENLFSSCAMSAEDMMNNYPILDWFPMMFRATGDCSKSSFSFFNLITMEQLTLFIFIFYLIAFSFFFYKKNKV